MNDQLLNLGDDSGTGRIKRWLLGFVGVLVVIPSVINSGTDIYKAILNSPIGGSETRNARLMKDHWEETALFMKDIEIKYQSGTKTLKLRVYTNADIWVKYGEQEQWLASSEVENLTANRFSVIQTTYASEAIAQDLGYRSYPILMEELEPAIVDLENIRVEKEKSYFAMEQGKSIERKYLFVETNESHSGFGITSTQYTKTFIAEDDFVFTDAKIDIITTNNAGVPIIDISDDKKSVTVKVKLKSGPFYDRWRGWIKADIITNQEIEQ